MYWNNNNNRVYVTKSARFEEKSKEKGELLVFFIWPKNMI